VARTREGLHTSLCDHRPSRCVNRKRRDRRVIRHRHPGRRILYKPCGTRLPASAVCRTLSLRHIPPDRGGCVAARAFPIRCHNTRPIRDIDRRQHSDRCNTRVIRNTPAATEPMPLPVEPSGHAANDQVPAQQPRTARSATDGTIPGRATVVPRLLRLHRTAV